MFGVFRTPHRSRTADSFQHRSAPVQGGGATLRTEFGPSGPLPSHRLTSTQSSPLASRGPRHLTAHRSAAIAQSQPSPQKTAQGNCKSDLRFAQPANRVTRSGLSIANTLATPALHSVQPLSPLITSWRSMPPTSRRTGNSCKPNPPIATLDPVIHRLTPLSAPSNPPTPPRLAKTATTDRDRHAASILINPIMDWPVPSR